MAIPKCKKDICLLYLWPFLFPFFLSKVSFLRDLKQIIWLRWFHYVAMSFAFFSWFWCLFFFFYLVWFFIFLSSNKFPNFWLFCWFYRLYRTLSHDSHDWDSWTHTDAKMTWPRGPIRMELFAFLITTRISSLSELDSLTLTFIETFLRKHCWSSSSSVGSLFN